MVLCWDRKKKKLQTVQKNIQVQFNVMGLIVKRTSNNANRSDNILIAMVQHSTLNLLQEIWVLKKMFSGEKRDRFGYRVDESFTFS